MSNKTEVPQLVELPWYETICPTLTTGEVGGAAMGRAVRVKQQKPMVVAALMQTNGPKAVEENNEPEDGPEFIACQGPRCAFFVVLRDVAGKPVQGRCAHQVAAAAAMGQLAVAREALTATHAAMGVEDLTVKT